MTLPAAVQTEGAPQQAAHHPGHAHPDQQLRPLRVPAPLSASETDQVYQRRVQAEAADPRGHENYPECDTPQAGNVKERLSVFLTLVLLLDLPLDTLEVEDGSPLGVVEAG